MLNKQKVYIEVDAQDELPVEYSRHILFFNQRLRVYIDCKFWFDSDGKRTHIEPNDEFRKHLMDSTDFTHWLKEDELYCFTKEELEKFTRENIRAGIKIAVNEFEANGKYVLGGIYTKPKVDKLISSLNLK